MTLTMGLLNASADIGEYMRAKPHERKRKNNEITATELRVLNAMQPFLQDGSYVDRGIVAYSAGITRTSLKVHICRMVSIGAIRRVGVNCYRRKPVMKPEPVKQLEAVAQSTFIRQPTLAQKMAGK